MHYLEQHATHGTDWVALDNALVDIPRNCPYLILYNPRTGLTDAVARELELRLVQMQSTAI
jgi:hypothetical protein